MVSAALAWLGLWAYRFRIPPLPVLARRALTALRVLALLVLVWLLAQPVLERARAGRAARLVVLLDRSASMDLPGAAAGATRAQEAARAVATLRDAWRGRARVSVLPFAARLATDSLPEEARGATAIGTALRALPDLPEAQEMDGVVVVSDGVVNAGGDPAAAARSLGVPVNAVMVGGASGPDRAVLEVEASARARVGEPTPVRVHVRSDEPRGTLLTVRLLNLGAEIGHAIVPAPGAGSEAVAEIHAIPSRPGLALWTARVDSMPGSTLTTNDAREVALEVAPGKLGVLIVSAGLNWDLAFVRRSLANDSSLAITTLARDRDGWRTLERSRKGAAPSAVDLRSQAVVVLDGIAPGEIGADFDRAVTAFVRAGGGLLVLGGPPPGLARFAGGTLGHELGVRAEARPDPGVGAPVLAAAARELLAWDDDPARGEQAWRTAAPLSDRITLAPTGGDRVLLAAAGSDSPLLIARRIGRGQALLLNGTGFWRWSLSSHDDLSADRGRLLWRRIARWLAEPVQGEPLRVRPERWVTPRGEPITLFASLQDSAFKPLAGAIVEGELRDQAGRALPVAFVPGSAGSYTANVDGAAPGRYALSVRATRSGRELGRASTELAVDRWSLELARTEPDSAGLQAMVAAAGGRVGRASEVARWARALPSGALARLPARSFRLWESPWVFAFVVGMLTIEWAWRRRRGLP